MKLTRRTFIAGAVAAAGAAAAGWVGFAKGALHKGVPGRIVGASDHRGHALRFLTGDGDRTENADIVIVGAGISGLAAARHLQSAGIDNFIILDLEEQAGGNAQGGRNEVSAYPWGAHYVTLAPKEADDVRKFYEESGIITGYDTKGLPIYNEYYICADPHERLYMHGHWQEGVIPQVGVQKTDLAQYEKFLKRMDDMRHAKGRDGRRAFVVPVDDSSRDPEFTALDNLTMKEWMEKEGFTSPYLQWYVDYGCRDDFGTTSQDTSAWAGIHYFAARNGEAANTASSNVLTWPEGNGFVVDKISEGFKDKIRTGTGAYKIEHDDAGVTVYCSGADKYKIRAKAVLLAIPRFISKHLLRSVDHDFTYAPWAVANITLGRIPAGEGAGMSWDNVVYNSKLLGYVTATHQSLERTRQKTVITYYWPLTHAHHDAARKELLAMSFEELRDTFLGELYRIHPEVRGHVENADIWRWGHGMIRPVKGFMWGKSRQHYLQQHPPVFHAHSDMSGISIFEEAYTRGVRTARDIEKHLKGRG